MLKAKFLNRQAKDEEMFRYIGMNFDIDKAEQIIQANPREPQKAGRAFIEAFVGKEHDLFGNYVNKEHLKNVNPDEPGIVALLQLEGKDRRRF